jgi:photosystem II stability/assembly factor-like uncharacterized protein
MKRIGIQILTIGTLFILFSSTNISTAAHNLQQFQGYFEDFQDSMAQGWDLEKGWEIIDDAGNMILSGQGHAWANSNQSLQDYRLSFRLKLIKGDIHLVYHMNKLGRYFISFNNNGSRLNKQYWPDTFIDNLAFSNTNHAYQTWHQVEIISQDASLTFIVNGITEWTNEDPEPLSYGSFAFETLDNSQAYIDDVVVTISGGSGQNDTRSIESLTWIRTGGPLGGLGYDVRMDPVNPDKMFVTDAHAGIFMSTDGGLTWFPSNEGISTREGPTGDIIPIFCLTIDPNNSDIVWTGFQNSRGIFKSTDGGLTWQLMVNGIIERQGISFRGFTVQPGNSAVVYAAAEISSWVDGREGKQGREFDMTQGVVYQSIDGGENWQAIWRGDNLARYIWIDPRDTNILYVSTGIFDREAYNSNPEPRKSGGEGILKSIDGGKTWNHVNNGLKNLYVGSLFMHPTNPDILLAGTGNNQYYQGNGIYLSLNGGENWEHVLIDDNITSVEFSESDPSIAYAGSAETIYRSENGGNSWKRISGGGTDGWGSPGVRAGFPIDFQVDPRDPNRIFANEYGGGNFLSTDGGKSWIDASRGYTGADMRGINVAPGEPGKVLSAARSGIFISYDGGSSWEGLCYPPVVLMEWNAVKFDPKDSEKIIGGSNWGNILAKSGDGGQSWKLVKTLPEKSMVGWRDIAFAPSNPNIIYAGTAGYFSAGSFSLMHPGLGIYVSNDGGDSWKPANNEITHDAHVTGLSVHPQTPNVVYASTANHGLLVTMDGAQSWQVVQGGLPSSLATSVAINPLDPQIIFTGFYNQAIYSSTDGGQTWNRSANGLPPEASIESIVFDPTNPAEVLYAADFMSGVYRSTDSGNFWQAINNGLTMRSVTKLAISDDGLHLYAATNGGGVFRLDLAGEPPKPAAKPITEAPTPTSPPQKAIPRPTMTLRSTVTEEPTPTQETTFDLSRWLISKAGAGLFILGAFVALLIVFLLKRHG